MTASSVLDLLFPIPRDSLAERRHKFVDGLRFLAVAAGTFFLVFLFLAKLDWSEGTRYVPVFPLLAGLIVVNVPFWLMGARRGFPLRHFYVHWILDLALITCVLHILGGVDAPYGFLSYLMIVVTSATFISKRASFVVAAGSSLATIGLVTVEAGGLLGHANIWAHHYTAEVQLVTVMVAVSFYFMFAYLAGTLADQLKKANSALAVAQTEIEDQNRLLEEKVSLRTQELEKRNSEIEEFVHIVTHDLRNLSIGATETARKLIELEGVELTDRGYRYARHVMEDTRNMNEMLRHLLAIFRADRAEAGRAPVDMKELAVDIFKAQAARVEAKGIKVNIEVLPTVIGDEAQMKHVLANLIDNAIKYVGDKSDPEIGVGAELAGDEWVICVSDNGIGVSREQQERIFSLYHRSPDQLVGGTIQGGDGVGLAISKRIVERWGGRIWVESKVGIGSKFRFSVRSKGAV